MRKLVYFWIEKYNQIDNIEGKPLYLFEDFGINLSSRYTLEHSWNKKKRIFSIKSIKEHAFMKDKLDKGFFSKQIADLKVVLGNNGAGKSTLINLLAEIVSQKDSHAHTSYVLIWEENGSFSYYKNELTKFILDSKNTNKRAIERFSVEQGFNCEEVHYFPQDAIISSTSFPNYWPNTDIEGKYDHLYDIRTQTLLKEDVEIHNSGIRISSTKNNLLCYSSQEEDKIVNFVFDFYNEKINSKFFLHEVLSVPSYVTFELSEANIKNGIEEIVNTLHKDSKEYYKKEWINYYNSLVEFDDQIKFAAIINTFRIWNSTYSHTKISPEFNLNNIRKSIDAFIHKIDSLLNFRRQSNTEENVFSLVAQLAKYAQHPWFSSHLQIYRIDIRENIKRIQEIRSTLKSMNRTTHFMTMNWGRPISSGESAYLSFFARLYKSLSEKKGKKFNGILFVDEIDLYLHPEWQRIWFARFIDGLSLIKKKLKKQINIQLILSTHSPFMVTDFSSENITAIQREKDETGMWSKTEAVPILKNNTMAGNIFDVLATGFFLNGTLGYFIEKKIKDVIERIESKTIVPDDEEFIERIGDPIIKAILKNRKGGNND